MSLDRTTWTFQPEDDVKSLVGKAVAKRTALKSGKGRRGLRTKLFNEALRAYLAPLGGKREQN